MTKSARLPLAILAATALVCRWPRHRRQGGSQRGLYAEMDAASQRYREARPSAAGRRRQLAAMSKALEDLEEVSQRCLKTKGCDTTRVHHQLRDAAEVGRPRPAD
jgi:hypothetical protein